MAQVPRLPAISRSGGANFAPGGPRFSDRRSQSSAIIWSTALRRKINLIGSTRQRVFLAGPDKDAGDAGRQFNLAAAPRFRERDFSFPDGKHGDAADPEHDADPARETNPFPKQNDRQDDPQNNRAGKRNGENDLGF